MANVYRKRIGHETWHFCWTVKLADKAESTEQSTKPTTGEFCNGCIAKRNNGNCS